MKVIVSHDVDHLTVWEHSRDLIIPKFLARNLIETFNGTIGTGEMLRRASALFTNRWQNISELMTFDRENGIPSTFFFGVNRGQYLVYPLEEAATWIRKLDAAGFDTGVHGISFDDPAAVNMEFERFSSILPGKRFGIRMHYLRQSSDTLRNLNAAGYLFDSTLREPRLPFREGLIWEFPLHLMDGDVLEEGKRWGHKPLNEVIETSKRIISEVREIKSPYLTVCFHDRYYSKAFSAWKEWYEWVITYCREQGFSFISFPDAVAELEQQRSSLNPGSGE